MLTDDQFTDETMGALFDALVYIDRTTPSRVLP